jgi:hypothetical protein
VPLLTGHRDALRYEGLVDRCELLGREYLAQRLFELRRGHITDGWLELLEHAKLLDRRICSFNGSLELLFGGRLRLGHRDRRGGYQNGRRSDGAEDACESEDAKRVHEVNSSDTDKNSGSTYAIFN